MNAQIDRLIEIEIEKARKRAEEEARRKAAAEAAAKAAAAKKAERETTGGASRSNLRKKWVYKEGRSGGEVQSE